MFKWFDRKVFITFIITLLASSAVFWFMTVHYVVKPLESYKPVLDVMNLIESRGLAKKTHDELVQGAIEGMIKTLDDPFTYYLPPDEYNIMQMRNEGYFGGIGIEVGVTKDGLTVIAPIEGTPAAKAGLKSKDVIIGINGKSAEKMTLIDAVKLIRGKQGTTVQIEILRNGKEKKQYTIVRGRIPIETVRGKMLDKKIGYLRISNFSETSSDEFAKVYGNLKKQNMRALIIDLRNNPGGTLSSAVGISQQIVPKGKILTVKYRTGEEMVYTSDLTDKTVPIVVLVNDGSASASEILTGALQDTKAATVVGTKSFGKGLVQSVYSLSNQAGIALTVAEYVTPKGRHINHIGIQPDIYIELPDTATRDVQLDKAIQVLNEQIKSQ